MRDTMRIVTICSSGEKAKRVTRNPNRIKLLQHCMHHIILKSGWTDIDAVLLAGGYFFHNEFLGHLPYPERKASLDNASFARDIKLFAYMLHHNGSPNAQLICGIDTKHRSEWENGDEFCVAFNQGGVAGVGRKAFPVDADTNQKRLKRAIATYASDFNDMHRIVRLACGTNALLCACYDMFGANVWKNTPSPRKSYIRYLYDGETLLTRNSPNFKATIENYVSAWQHMIKEREVGVVLSSIHEFGWPNAELYWQRHGIATASAAQGGILALAAANYRDFLPEPEQSPLAAFNVSYEHVHAGNYRKAEPFAAKDALEEFHVDNESALIRLFEVPIE